MVQVICIQNKNWQLDIDGLVGFDNIQRSEVMYFAKMQQGNGMHSKLENTEICGIRGILRAKRKY